MPEQLGAYVLDRRIGAGGMADVFLARGPNGVCVIKRPHSHLCASAEFVRMFLDEASLLAQLHHPSIARIFDLGQQNGVYYLAMEYVPGFDLMTISLEHERQGEFMSPELAAKVVADAAGALHYAHNAVGAKGRPLNIIHRDVSPHNILVSTRGEVKMIDFGVARAAKTMHRTQAGLVKGKYPYMAPEQITGQTIDCRVDVYALGLVLYELLTNARAIAGDLEVHQIENARHGRIKPVEQLRPNVPARLRTILAGALHPQPEGRYQTAAALQADLESYIRSDRQIVGKEDLVRLFRVVAAEASHLPPEFDMSSKPPGSDPSHDETFRPPPAPIPSPVPHPTDEIASHRPTDQVPVSQHGAEMADEGSSASTAPLGTMSPIPLNQPLAPGVQVGGAADIELSPETDQSPAHRPANQASELIGVTQEAMPTPHAFDLPPMPVSVPVPPPPLNVPPPPGNRGLLAAVVVGVLVLGGAAAFFFWPRPPPVIVDAPPRVVDPPKAVEDPPKVVVDVPPKVEDPPPPVEDPPKDPPRDPPKVVEPVRAAVLHVTSTPPMEVVVDKKSWGVSPVDVEVPAGAHRVVLQSLELGIKQPFSIKLAGGEKRDLNFVPKKGKIRVEVEPFGAITIDGKVVASGTSMANAEVYEGERLVVVSNVEMKATASKKVTVKAGEEVEVKINLKVEGKPP